MLDRIRLTMTSVFYASTAGVCAIVLLILLNRTLYINARSKKNMSFGKLLVAALVFCCVDTVWGVIAFKAFAYRKLLLGVTSYIFYIMIALVAWLWFRYTISYFSESFAKFFVLKALAIMLAGAQLVILVVNAFKPIVFYIDSIGIYRTNELRIMVFALQFANYFIMLMLSVIARIRTKDTEAKLYSGTAVVFSIIPTVVTVVWYFFSNVPVFSLGFMVSCITIYAYTITYEQQNLMLEAEKLELNMNHEKQLRTDFVIMKSLLGKLDYVGIVDAEASTVSSYIIGDHFSRYINKDQMTIDEIDSIFKSILSEDVYVEYMEKTNPEKILKNLEKQDAYKVYFPIVEDEVENQYSIEFMKNPDDENLIIMGIRNVSEKLREEREREEVEYRATIDGLTGLLNKITFNERATQYIAKKTSKDVALIYLDLDHFKDINDWFGHDKGDDILRVTADRMKTCFRRKEYVARPGGDEFCIFVPETNMQELTRRVDVLHEVLKNTCSNDNVTVNVSSSIGCVLCRSSKYTFEQLVKKADETMYEVKRSGRDGYMIQEVKD